MIDLEDKKHCMCKKYNNSQSECLNEYTISEKGKTVKLEVKHKDETCSAIVIDQCIITDNNTKCDALFLFNSVTKKVSFLTELKGAGDIPKAFRQLSYTKNGRDEYQTIINKFKLIDNKKIIEKFVIISNGILDKNEREKLENEYKIRVTAVLHSEATTPVPNLRDYI